MNEPSTTRSAVVWWAFAISGVVLFGSTVQTGWGMHYPTACAVAVLGWFSIPLVADWRGWI